LTTEIPRPQVDVPEPQLSGDELVARAASFQPLLREEQASTEARGCHSVELDEKFIGAGFYRCLQPRCFGGYEFDLPVFIRMVAELARGCPSTGWCVGVSAAHTLILASYFPEQAQIESFGADGHVVAAAVGSAAGTATYTPDGWVVNGTWPYCSGSPFATHFIPSVKVVDASDDNRPTTIGMAVIPSSQWTMLDDWGAVLGLRGSGSNSIAVNNARLPVHSGLRIAMTDVDVSQGTAGYRLHGNPLYAGRGLVPQATELAAVMIGAGRAMIDEYMEILRTRSTIIPPRIPRFQHHDSQRVLGMATTMVDGAEAALFQIVAQHQERCIRGVSGGEPPSLIEDYRGALGISQAFRQVAEAADMMFRTGGSSAAKNGERLQRYFRDVSMYRTHLSAQYEAQSEILGRMLLGSGRRAGSGSSGTPQ
jgi:3-hydroxy-9,10-secoandrosta-1,3,5(10)-triene-9,17-dione monooxygenase